MSYTRKSCFKNKKSHEKTTKEKYKKLPTKILTILTTKNKQKLPTKGNSQKFPINLSHKKKQPIKIPYQ
jgi:hypothetical protein